MKNLIKIMALSALLISFSVLAISCGGDSAKNEEEAAASASTETANERFALYDIDRNLRKWSEFEGKPLVINFWATWCGPCMREIPTLKQLYSEYKEKGVEIIGISVDQQNTVRNVVPYVQQQQIPWVILYADGTAVREFGLGQSIPTTVFLNAKGEETGRIVGAQPHSVFAQEFEKILN